MHEDQIYRLDETLAPGLAREQREDADFRRQAAEVQRLDEEFVESELARVDELATAGLSRRARREYFEACGRIDPQFEKGSPEWRKAQLRSIGAL